MLITSMDLVSIHFNIVRLG